MSGINLKSKRVAVYGRFSTDKQNEDSAQDQIDRCVRFVEKHEGHVPNEARFKDEGVSGASLQRAGFERLMTLVRARKFDAVVVEDSDRLSRNFGDTANLYAEMIYYDVEVIFASDGASSLAPSAKMMFYFKGIISEQQLDVIRDKTLRGQTAKFNAGHATGGVSYGFKTTKKMNGEVVVAHVISLNDDQVPIVQRIFNEYLAGRSLALITSGLNADRIPPPRSKKRKGSPVWGDSTVRGILHNEVYAGVWHFARRKWTKMPRTNVRRPKPRSQQDRPVSQNRPHLRIIDEETWSAVQRRLADVRQHYTKGNTSKGSIGGKPNNFVLSGILVCDHCGSLMFVTGRGASRRYRCTGNARRGICQNRLTVLESVARARILEAVRLTVTNDFGLAYARKMAAQRLGDRERVVTKELKVKEAELVKTEARIRSLIEQLADSGAADYLRQALDELAAKAKQLKADIASLGAAKVEPVVLPDPATIRAIVGDLQAFVERDPLAGREYLRKLLRNQQVRLHAQPDGVYLAKTEVLPLVLLTETPPSGSLRGAPSSRQCCGGRI